MNKIIDFFNRHTNQKVFRVIMLLFFVSVFIVNNQWFGQTHLKQITSGLGMIEANVINSVDSMYEHLAIMQTEGRLVYLTLLKLDYLLILTMGMFQIISILRLIKGISEKLQMLIVLPIARGMIDGVENVFLHAVISIYPSKNVLLLKITNALIFVKWIAFWVTIVVLLSLVIVNIYLKIKRRKRNMSENIKIVALTSSARKNSIGKELTEHAKKGAEKSGAVVEIIDLNKSGLRFCTGCLLCMETGKCVLNDSFQEIKGKLQDADGIIMCSPTFCGTYNTAMKNFVDRLGLLERFTSSLGNKYVLGISTAGSSRAAKRTASEMANLYANGIFSRGYVTGSMGASVRIEEDSNEKNKCLKMAYGLGVKLAEDIRERKKYALQNMLQRLLSKYILRPAYKKVIEKSKDTNTKGVYQNLAARNLI